MNSKLNIFHQFSVNELVSKISSKELDPYYIAESCISNYRNLNYLYQPFTAFSEKSLLENAKRTKIKLKNGGNLGALQSIPVGIKDIFNTCDYPTEMGSQLWKGFTPGNDARVIYNLKQAESSIVGKTVTAEFAVHALNQTTNPHNVELTPGTSSSGSAVAITLGIVPISIGSQTAGSIIRPASFNGVYGCKPSFGLIPRTGSLKTTDSLDTVGFFTNFAEDLRLVFDSCRVHGHNFPISHKALTNNNRQTKADGEPWRVAVVKGDSWSVTPLYAKEAFTRLIDKLTRLKEIEICEPNLPFNEKNVRKLHETIYNKSLWYYFRDEYKSKDLISPLMSELLESGFNISVESYQNALREQAKIILAHDEFMKDYDIVLTLSSSGHAPLRSETELPDTSLLWTFCHVPSVSAPAFVHKSTLPFGLQICARKYNDYLLFNFLDYLVINNLLPRNSFPRLSQ